jgi:hypothetical protein
MDGEMSEAFDAWKLCDEFTVDQAAHLIVGMPPGFYEGQIAYGNDLSPSEDKRFHMTLAAATNALLNAVKSGRVAPVRSVDLPLGGAGEASRTFIHIDSIRKWLKERGIKRGFFFTEPDIFEPGYLKKTDTRYAPKLAAAVRAWEGTSDESATKGKSPKQALMKWLREHASEFELSDEEGKPNELGIEEAAKVANWQRGGGAPKTPGT